MLPVRGFMDTVAAAVSSGPKRSRMPRASASVTTDPSILVRIRAPRNLLDCSDKGHKESRITLSLSSFNTYLPAVHDESIVARNRGVGVLDILQSHSAGHSVVAPLLIYIPRTVRTRTGGCFCRDESSHGLDHRDQRLDDRRVRVVPLNVGLTG